MIKYTRLFITILLAGFVLQASAQSTATTSSPYSRYGLGLLSPQVLPQNIGMGGIGVATNSFSGYYNANPLNPASYAKIGLTVIDIGMTGSTTTLSQDGSGSHSDGNFRLSHVVFAVPVTKRSALSFGLMPYSELGYNYQVSSPNLGTNSPADTNAVNRIYSGNGGISKAFLGYGFGIGKHFMIGANFSYLFGNLQQFSSQEIPNLSGYLNSREEYSYSIRGVNFDYGAQYSIDVAPTKHIILGYSGSNNSTLGSQYTHIVSQYTYDASGNENNPLDSLVNTEDVSRKIKLPFINRFGVSFVNDGKLLVAADYTMSNWSQFNVQGQSKGQDFESNTLTNGKTLNVGGQFTPNINALNNYWSTVDYRLGFMYDQSYINADNQTSAGTTNIKSYALTFGFGFPLRPSASGLSFYKINFATEIGQRGTLADGLIKEKYINFHLSFMLNDKWFQKYKLE